MTGTRASQVIVVGASMAGLLAARALAPHVESVVILEREQLPDDITPRSRVPQGRHLHVLLASGLDLLSEWFPGIEDELEAHGAVRVDGTGAWVFQGGGYRHRGDWGRPQLAQTRPLLEHVVRSRVAALPHVRMKPGVSVEEVLLSPPGARGRHGGQGPRVRGVLADGVERQADLVVDCSGRNSPIARQLAASGALDPPVTRVGIDIGYASFFLRRSPGDFEGQFAVCFDTPGSYRLGAVMPVEGDRWMATVGGVHGDVPPSDEAGVLAFAESLPSPLVSQFMARCERVSDIETYRFPSSQRRHFEKVDRPLPGLVTLGDAASSFDPIYGQGMTSAALQAVALDEVVGDLLRGAAAPAAALHSPDLPRRFYRKAARIIDAPWRIAVGGDFAHPATVGARPLGTDLLNAYMERLVRATHTSLPVTLALNRVLQLTDPPTSLVAPPVLARVLRARGRSPAETGAPIEHPRVGSR
jgi:2-polyprenyl-6-methoxyphenol hydroxylase-like FAD-dependent oxidoreductase